MQCMIRYHSYIGTYVIIGTYTYVFSENWSRYSNNYHSWINNYRQVAYIFSFFLLISGTSRPKRMQHKIFDLYCFFMNSMGPSFTPYIFFKFGREKWGNDLLMTLCLHFFRFKSLNMNFMVDFFNNFLLLKSLSTLRNAGNYPFLGFATQKVNTFWVLQCGKLPLSAFCNPESVHILHFRFSDFREYLCKIMAKFYIIFTLRIL